MDDNRAFWNELAPAAMRDAGSQPEPTILSTSEAVEHPDMAAHMTNSYDSVVSLHPDLRLALVESLHGDAGSANNLCILVGTVTREYQRNRRGSGKNDVPQGEEHARTMRTPLGTTESMLRLEVQEVLGDGLNTALTSYSMPLHVSAKLAATGVFRDGQRIAISGPLRMERTYDLRFATGDLDLGLPAWTLRLDAISIQPLAEDSDILDGSWVQLEGEVEDEPVLRFRPIGPLAAAPFASVRLRCRRPLRGGFPGSRAQFQSSVIIPLEVSLDGEIAHAGALLKRGNRVRVEGRLAPYQVRRNPTPSGSASARQKETAALLQGALARAEMRVRDSGGDDHRVRAAKLRLLTSTELTVSVGYSELQHGTELTGEQIAELIATRPRRARQSREEDRPAARSPEMEAVTPALDAATGAKLGGDALLTEDTASDDESADDTVTVKHARPRRRIREMSPTDEVATDGRADDA